MSIDAILFDKDGTLFHFGGTWEGWAEGFLLRATDQDRGRARQIGRRIGYDLDSRRFEADSVVIAGTTAEIAAELAPHFPALSPEALLDLLNKEAETVPQVEAVPLVPFLDGLRGRGLRLGVATNDAEAPARAHLGAARVLDRFDFIAGFDSGHGAKPEPGPLLAFCAAVDVDPARTVMVGDSTHDLHAGRAAGMVTLGVLTGIAGAEDLGPHADMVLPDIGHIPAWLAARG